MMCPPMPSDANTIDAIDVALAVARAIESVGGQYFVGGSLASSFQGEPRATNDIDVVVRLPLAKLRAFADALGQDFEVDLDMVRDAVLRGGSCNVFYLPLLTKVDLFAVGGSPSTRESSRGGGPSWCARAERCWSSQVPRG